MRITALSSTLVLGTLSALAVPARAEHKASHVAAPQVADEPFLAAGDITALVAPHNVEIQRCYLDEVGALRRSAHLDLTFVITRDGDVLSLKAAAAGVSARTAHKIETCIHAEVDGIQFPARRNDTTAVVPFLFQKTEAPNAGPQLSCWDPKGC